MSEEREYLPGRKPVPYDLKDNSAYKTHSDANSKCPYCYSSLDQNFVGLLMVDDQERPTYHCPSCNKVHATLPTYIKVLADNARSNGAEKVGFVPADGSSQVVNSTSPASYNYQIDDTNRKLDQMNSNVSMLSSTIQSMMYEIQELAQQNNKLMEQLAKDPMISIRKSVQEFNLK